MAAKRSLSIGLEKLSSITSDPENFLSVREDLSESARDLTKLLYDFTKTEEKLSSAVKSNALPELIIDQFDEEQIWQEIELQNEENWAKTLTNVSKLLSAKNDFAIPVKFGESDAPAPDEDKSDSHSDESDDEDQEEEEYPASRKNSSKSPDGISDSNSNTKYKTSIVDDKFFKLRQMEAFLDAEDKNEMLKDKKSKRKNKQESSDEDEDEDVDLFEGWESDENEEDEEEEDDPKYMKYSEFFDDGPQDNKSSSANRKSKIAGNEDDFDDNYEQESNDDVDDSDADSQDKDKTSSKKRVSFNLPQPSSDDDDDDDDSQSGEEQENAQSSKEAVDMENMSEYQKRQERLKKKIGHLENNLLQEKSWPMKGEVDATNRPQNSLLEEVVDFDVISRPAPIITEETTVKLQDIIIQRIKDKTWDDVVRKSKPTQEIQEFKKQIVLDQEKSKLSLAQVYEQEYIKQRDALDPDADDKPDEEPEAHVEIRKALSSLFVKLDALCNFHYTPKVAVPEVKIISNMPAITMEEVAPVATAEAALLAPEEVKAKPKGDMIGKSERTKTDMKRERRQKKIRQREKEKEKQKREKLVDKLRPGLGNKYSKEKMTKLLNKVTKERNVDKMEMTHDKKSLTSSTAFFNQLQEEVTNTIKTKLNPKKSKMKQLSGKQFKL